MDDLIARLRGVTGAVLCAEAADALERAQQDAERWRWAAPLIDGTNDRDAERKFKVLAHVMLTKGLVGNAAVDAARRRKP